MKDNPGGSTARRAKTALLFVLLLIPTAAIAQPYVFPHKGGKTYDKGAPSKAEAKAKARAKALSYANAIACGVGKETIVLPLSPYTSLENRSDARYMVLWNGDIGCQGGSGTSSTHFTMVKVSVGDSYVVMPKRSAPFAKFESPVSFVERVAKFKEDTVVMEGKDHGPHDAACCPSVKVQFTLKVDSVGNWRRVSKTKVGPKPSE